jgi:hypothetical protein
MVTRFTVGGRFTALSNGFLIKSTGFKYKRNKFMSEFEFENKPYKDLSSRTKICLQEVFLTQLSINGNEKKIEGEQRIPKGQFIKLKYL